MPNIRLVVEYNGAKFSGWQSQPGVRTVEDTLRQALVTILRQPIRVVYASGRTDAGVHARGQVVNFHLQNLPDLHRLKAAVSGLLRNDLAVLKAEVVPDSFHSRFDAKCKQYSYRILNRPAPATFEAGMLWHIAAPLDREMLLEMAGFFVGTHDFASFQTAGSVAETTVRTISESQWRIDGDYLTYTVVGDGFLRHMVRALVGTMVARAKNFPGLMTIPEILQACDRRKAGPTAPPYGLYLDWVRY